MHEERTQIKVSKKSALKLKELAKKQGHTMIICLDKLLEEALKKEGLEW